MGEEEKVAGMGGSSKMASVKLLLNSLTSSKFVKKELHLRLLDFETVVILKEHLGFPHRGSLGPLPPGGGVSMQPEEGLSRTPQFPQRDVTPPSAWQF